jgi:hypothetical protein
LTAGRGEELSDFLQFLRAHEIFPQTANPVAPAEKLDPTRELPKDKVLDDVRKSAFKVCKIPK